MTGLFLYNTIPIRGFKYKEGLRQLQIYWHWSQLFTILIIDHPNFIWSYEDFLFKTHLQQGDYRVNGLFSLYCCWRLCHCQVSLDLREETAALCLSVFILEFLTALCVRVEQPFLSSCGFLLLIAVVVRRGETVLFTGLNDARMFPLFRASGLHG